jgi:hypothetical protein
MHVWRVWCLSLSYDSATLSHCLLGSGCTPIPHVSIFSQEEDVGATLWPSFWTPTTVLRALLGLLGTVPCTAWQGQVIMVLLLWVLTLSPPPSVGLW